MTNPIAHLGAVAHLHGSAAGLAAALRKTGGAGGGSQVGGPVSVGWAVVTATGTGPASVTIKLRGSSSTIAGVRYGKWYTPTVGDVVMVLEWATDAGQDRVVIGPLA